MKVKDGRTLWRVEVKRVLYVLADDKELASEMGEAEMFKHNEAESEVVSVKKATVGMAMDDGWYHSLPYGGDSVNGSVRLISALRL